MNPDIIKSELQQVLDNDLALRKEFNELRRSLSDYRNQLIMRDEDCKRLQVTIDVLNTKLAVLERDNNSYKSELASFKELRGSISEQLELKQQEIDARIEEIRALRDEAAALSSDYEERMANLRDEHAAEVGRIVAAHESAVNELRTNAQYREAGMREDYENRLTELTNGWAEKEQTLVLNHQEVVSTLATSHEMEVALLKETHAVELLTVSSDSREQIAALKAEHENSLKEIGLRYESELASLRSRTQDETAGLSLQLELQRSALTAQFEANISALSDELNSRQEEMRQSYEQQIAELNERLASGAAEAGAAFEMRIETMAASHEEAMRSSVMEYETRIADLVNDYEAKLSNTLIHSTSQNSKLTEELERARLESERTGEIISELNADISGKQAAIEAGALRIGELEAQLRSEAERFLSMETEFTAFRQNALLTSDEKVEELNNQIATLNQSHSGYVAELCARIDGLNDEVRNLGCLFEATSNQLGETENTLEWRNAELEAARAQLAEQESALESFRESIRAESQEIISARELEFQKLLAENTNLISEIDAAQDKVEAQEAELELLRTELQELKMVSAGKTQDFKETLSAKNFEITSLEATSAALKAEVELQKETIASLREGLMKSEEVAAEAVILKERNEALVNENAALSAELAEIQNAVMVLNSTIQDLNHRLSASNEQIATLASSSAGKDQEREEFIGKLFRQIDALNDEKLSLLDEKEQMALQLLKLNEVVGSISQQVESERIDVSGLNNHRQNVILAGNSKGNADPFPMKKQINELVREIDKCIALLSA